VEEVSSRYRGVLRICSIISHGQQTSDSVAVGESLKVLTAPYLKHYNMIRRHDKEIICLGARGLDLFGLG
jgi:hypothetical protein